MAYPSNVDCELVGPIGRIRHFFFNVHTPDMSLTHDYFALEELVKALKRGQDISPLLCNTPCHALTVSTIHKAKGREFDHVYLVSGFHPKPGNTEEARVWYVGATRPKSVLTSVAPLRIYVSTPTPMNRRMLTGRRYRYTFCQNLVVGLPGDVDIAGFICGDLEESLRTQEYIAHKIRVDDALELVCTNDSYDIFHEKRRIGRLNVEVAEDFWRAVKKTSNKKNIPPRLTEIYVKNIVSIVPSRFPSGVALMFKESNFWLGIELTGFAKVDWHGGGKAL